MDAPADAKREAPHRDSLRQISTGIPWGRVGPTARESIETLVANVEALVARMGQGVDPDLARLHDAIYVDAQELLGCPPALPRPFSRAQVCAVVVMIAATTLATAGLAAWVARSGG